MAVCRLLPAFVTSALLLLLTSLPAYAATEATSSASAEQTLVQLINDRRADAGGSPLTARADLHGIARDWSFTQAERDRLGHNPNLTSQACCWTKIAENVARSSGHDRGDARRVAHALMELWRSSSSHDRTMTDPEVDQVGIGVVVDDDGTAWGTAVFRRCDGSSCTGGAQGPAGDATVSWAPPPPPPEPEPEPKPEPEHTPSSPPSRSPSPSPPPSPSPSPSPSPAPSPSPSPSPSPPPSPSPSPSPSPAPSLSPSPAPEVTPSPAPEVTPLEPIEVTGEPSRAGTDAGTLLVLVGAVLALGTAFAVRRRP